MFRRLTVAIGIGVLAVASITSATLASQSTAITIETSKAPGPVVGTFSAHGALTDVGSIVNVAFTPSASGAQTFGVTHVKILFTGASGTFTINAQIVEYLTSDPNVLTDTGTWTVIDGTGAYAGLHGVGTVSGTVDDNVNLISRTYAGFVHFD